MTRHERVVYTAAAAYARAGAIVDAVLAAPIAAGRAVRDGCRVIGRAVRNGWRLIGPGIALSRPLLHCESCGRTQHYVSRTTLRLLAQGWRVSCWWCGRRMIRLDPQNPQDSQ